MLPRSERGQAIDLTGEARLPNLYAERARRKAYIKAAETEVQAIETELKAKIGSHEAASVPGWRVTGIGRVEAVIGRPAAAWLTSDLA